VTTTGGTTGPVLFTVNPPPGLILASIAPTFGAQGASVAVTLTGTNLTGATLNLPLGITATAVTATATQITATLAIAATAALGPQSITASSAAAGTSNFVLFTVNPPPPTLTSVAPAAGVAASSVIVTLTGTHLTGSTINPPAGITATGVTVLDTQITATFAIAATATAGPASVTVTTPGGTSNAVSFNILPPSPTLSALAPTFGVTGTSVPAVFAGANLTGATLNLPAGITATAVTVTATQINATLAIPAAAPLGLQTITVTTPSGTSNAVAFTLNPPPPTLVSVAPAVGNQGSNVPVTFTGTNLVAGTTLILPAGITTLGVPVVTPTSITATLVIAANATTGLQGISVTTAGGTSNAVSFQVNVPLPVLTSITPAAGGQTVIVPVTLIGTGLTGATVKTGAGLTVVNLVFVSSTQINAAFVIAATAPLGAQSITVTTAGGTSNALTFTVLPPPPAITSLNSPFSRSATTNNQGVTLQGTNLGGAAAITAIHVQLNGVNIPLVVSAVPVAGDIIVVSGSFKTGATQLNWNQTIPTSFPASSATNVYTMTVTTPSGTSPAFGFSVQ
jgi:hypothetical protein